MAITEENPGYKWVGTRPIRPDGLEKVTGKARFGADLVLPGMLYGKVVRSPHAHARIVSIDTSAAESMEGVKAVITGADFPDLAANGAHPSDIDVANNAIARDKVLYEGHVVAAVAAITREQAEAAAKAVAVTYEVLPHVLTVDEAMADNAPLLHEAMITIGVDPAPEEPSNIASKILHERGDLDQGFGEADTVVEREFTTKPVHQGYIEPHAAVADANSDGRAHIWCSSQGHFQMRAYTATVLGVSPGTLKVTAAEIGGGFGGKLDASIQLPLAVAAWRLNRPVRAIYTRIESMASSTKRHPATITARAAANGDGLLSAFEMRADFDTGAYASWGPTVADRVPVHATGPYLVPNILVDSRSIYTNSPPSGAFRGFGVPQAAILQERLYDDLAEQLDLDPFEFRYRNAIRAGVPTATGQILTHSVGLVECLDALRPHWDKLRMDANRQNAANNAPRRRGVGVGCMWYGCGNTSMSNPSTMHVTLERNGKLTLFSGAVDIGQGSNTVMLQICADALGLSPANFSLVLGDTDLTADAGKTSASRQTFVSGKAAFNAGRAMRAEILRLANSGDEAVLRLEGAHVIVEEDGRTISLDLSTLPTQIGGDVVLKSEGTFDPPTTPLDADGQGNPYATFGFAAQIADLEVDRELGTVHLKKIIAAHDLGRAINPTLVEGQIHGGIAQGIGLALMEEYIPGQTENLHDYLIPTFGDVPDIDVILVEDPEPHGPYGAKGIGEPALVPTAPAIFGAIRHATGVRASQVPLLPHRLKAELDALKDHKI